MPRLQNERSRTKIIATVGPASRSSRILEQMIKEGVDVFRINFSHGTHQEHLEIIGTIRDLNKRLGSGVAIMADLQGPKLRIGEMQGGSVELIDGQSFDFLTRACEGDREKAFISYRELPGKVSAGERILVDDGRLVFEVTGSNGEDTISTRVIAGGWLSSRKGVNLPQTEVTLPSLTEKDRKDVRFALEQGLDWIALSFVRRQKDIGDLRRLLATRKSNAQIIAKIEKPGALAEIDAIIEAADAIMVARGDLGVEVEFHRIPLIQKSIIRKCLERSKPVIVATQMMESMIQNPAPTRAEVNDVANAVLDGADTVMLSGETSVGRYPVQTIRHMQQIIDSTEKEGLIFYRSHEPQYIEGSYLPDSICFNAVRLAQQVGAAAIICLTHSGYTAVKISSHRPGASIFAFTMNRDLIRHLSLVWGVRAYFFDESEDVNEYLDYTEAFLLREKLLKKGDLVVHVGSIPIMEKGKTNMMKLTRVKRTALDNPVKT